MSPTESPARRTAGALFDGPAVRVMAPADFEFPGGGTAEGLVDALVCSWTAEGQDGLAAMGSGLKAIAAELSLESAEPNGEVSILCYTMF